MESTNRDRPRVPGERALRITWLQSEVGEQGCLGNGSPASPHACVDTSASRTTKTRINNGMKREKFLKVKKPLKVGTLNVRTVRKEGRLDELVYNFEDFGLSILGIQEHRLEHCEDLSYRSIGKSTFITASCTRNARNSKVGGVGILLSKASYQALSSIEKINDRVIVRHLTETQSVQ